MFIVTTLGNVAVSCFFWFCLGWVLCIIVCVCVCVTELSQMPGQGRRNFCGTGAAEVLLRRKTVAAPQNFGDNAYGQQMHLLV